MSSPSRTLAILDLFTQERPVWSIEDAAAALGYTRPTAYRYFRQLIVAGLLQKTGAGKYALGARFIQIDYQIRQSDPVLLASVPVMDELTKTLGQSALLSKMFGDHLINIHHTGGPEETLPFPHSRGRPRSLFRGAAPKLMLSFLPRSTLVRLYDTYHDEIERCDLGNSWVAFRKHLSKIRKRRFYFSIDEVGTNVGGAAVVVQNDEKEVVATLSIAGRSTDLMTLGAERVQAALESAAEEIHLRLVASLAAGKKSSPG